MIRVAALSVVCCLACAPAPAQQTEDGESLMERGLGLFLEGLREEMSPALEEMRKLAEEYGPALSSFLQEMGPAFGRVLGEVRDWSAYEAPEVLPNGDIIIRKKARPEAPDAPVVPQTPADPPPAGQTDI